MIKLAKYLKPFMATLILSIVLLFGQAMADLNLPSYMSDIVNTGIQQSGIENAVPEAISENGYTLMTTFMTDQEKSVVAKNYTLVSAGDQKYVKEYPLVKTENIYVRNAEGPNSTDELNAIFGEAAGTFINVSKELAAKSGGKAAPAKATDMSDVNFDELYSMIPTFQKLPPEIIDSARAKAEQMDPAMQKQTGVGFVKLLYNELGVDIGSLQNAYILKTGLIMLLIALGGAAATVGVGYLSARIAAGVAKKIRRDIFEKVESFSNNEFDKFSTSSLITRTTNDVTQVQTLLIMGIRIMCYAPILGIGGIIMVLKENSSMTWIIGVAVFLLLLLIGVIFSIAMPKFKLIQKLIDRLNLVSRENLSGLMVVRAFGTQKFEENRFDAANTDLTQTNLFINRVMVFMMPAMMLIMNFITLLIVWVGSKQIADSAMQVGDMMAFIQYAMQIIMSFLMISMMFIMVPRASVSAGRIAEVLNTEPSILDPKDPKPFNNSNRGLVEFRNVSFRYENAEEDVLHNISFTAKPGETTAIIGSTGAGKSTLINLIPRFYDATAGEIFVNGVNVKEVTQHDLHDQIGYVPQKGVLLSGTIASNLRYGKRDATDEDVQKAAEIAQAQEFISKQEEGYDKAISEGGTNVSGGQKQRLSIARALVKKPPIYIFDDSFSALDYKTDVALRRALKEQTGDSTVLIVAQRVSTIMTAEQIIVINDGEVVGIGTHEELLRDCPTYYEIASSQLSKEELQ
ncbi:ABC transporter ATP-binding protein/permease [Paenibacillus sp. KQZ6P-2]|uniref:ABC transporter ATP-binding protein/permease n=1 Tax=Paenibacillus mangrovi TaxID=2931978 RepID=A0A9X2B3V1_9BACL|nr:ABC transporter ATP-binding protein [Paenibacillus mangrovi]MCJ8013979.1 ABC transporter ATP-binding protein/permease [Paenibacillus mangrovi]